MDEGEPLITTERGGLAAEIEAAVRAIPGVRNVYRSGSLISNALRAGAVALGARDDGEPLVAVVLAEGGVAVEASIGVDFSSTTADILRAVHGAIDALLGAEGLRRQSITLNVVYVQSREAS